MVGLGACGRVWAHVAGGRGMPQGIGAYGRGSGGDMAGPGNMWQHVGACGSGGGLWQGVGSYGMAWGQWHRMGHVTRAMGIWQGEGMETHGRGWGHVSGCGGMWQGVGASHKGWGHMAGAYVKKSKMLTMNEVHKNFNLTQ